MSKFFAALFIVLLVSQPLLAAEASSELDTDNPESVSRLRWQVPAVVALLLGGVVAITLVGGEDDEEVPVSP